MHFKLTTPKDKEAVRSYLDLLPEGKRYNVSIVLHREKRSVDQNRLLWLWLGCISAETGQDKDSLHDYFKLKFLGFDTKTLWGTQLYSPVSTKSLDTKQFTDYLERVQAFACAELGIILPNPEDQYWEQFYEQYKNHL